MGAKGDEQHLGHSTDYLLAGAGGGSKRARAEKLGVPVIDLAELERLAAEAEPAAASATT